jgi:hypothetical protein
LSQDFSKAYFFGNSLNITIEDKTTRFIDAGSTITVPMHTVSRSLLRSVKERSLRFTASLCLHEGIEVNTIDFVFVSSESKQVLARLERRETSPPETGEEWARIAGEMPLGSWTEELQPTDAILLCIECTFHNPLKRGVSLGRIGSISMVPSAGDAIVPSVSLGAITHRSALHPISTESDDDSFTVQVSWSTTAPVQVAFYSVHMNGSIAGFTRSPQWLFERVCGIIGVEVHAWSFELCCVATTHTDIHLAL